MAQPWSMRRASVGEGVAQPWSMRRASVEEGVAQPWSMRRASVEETPPWNRRKFWTRSMCLPTHLPLAKSMSWPGEWYPPGIHGILVARPLHR